MDPIQASPAPGERIVRHVGDSLLFTVSGGHARIPDTGWKARLRTTLGRAAVSRADILRAHTERVPPFGASWHDVPLTWNGRLWTREFALTEVGFFAAKPYLIDPSGYQHWPHGPDAGVSVHPDWCRTGNTIYCAFTRLFGKTRTASQLQPLPDEEIRARLEQQGFAVLPPSGTFRDLTRHLPHIVGRLGCRILHLLPIHPTPTVHARFGPMGSPYAALDLTAVDPALVEFDRRTTGIQQFEELTRAAHALGARVFLDIVINHTGWGSRLFEEHPEFFRREPDGRFASPGAWGVVWEDLVELEQRDVALWDLISDALLTWCRRGVDGFRCDAGYKIPTHVWQYVIARVRTEFPDTVFLLEGLGGSWDATESLLTEGGMQWAYSELFQNYSPADVHRYLDYALRQSSRVGTYVHYSETHDNDRLAAKGRTWSLLRNRLCALASTQGGYGFTCGVEWLAAEKIRVHQRTGLAWNAPDNIVDELARLNQLLSDHPAFFDGAHVRVVSPPDAPAVALVRTSADGASPVLVLANPSLDRPATINLPAAALPSVTAWQHELLGQSLPSLTSTPSALGVTLPPAAVYCLGSEALPDAGSGRIYRDTRARLAWALQTAAELVPAEQLSNTSARVLLPELVDTRPHAWLAAVSELAARAPDAPLNLDQAVQLAREESTFPRVMEWHALHARRISVVPPGWWLLIRHPHPFRASLRSPEDAPPEHVTSVPVRDGHVAAFPPRHPAKPCNADLLVDSLAPQTQDCLQAKVRFLASEPVPADKPDLDGTVLLTNGRGGMARLNIDLGSIRSKYDAALAANLHPDLPVDRHVFVKRVRVWVNADGFISPLDRYNLKTFTPGPPACWTFHANAGNGRHVTLQLAAWMLPGRNTVALQFSRAASDNGLAVTLTLRPEIEDRSFHAETLRNAGSEHHFHSHTHTQPDGRGFAFTPAQDRTCRIATTAGRYHPQPEWSDHIAHPVEAARGQVGEGAAYSPGWFEIPLQPGEIATLLLDAEPAPLPPEIAPSLAHPPEPDDNDPFEARLRVATGAFLARRETGTTVIAGYPWFLDWGRDTFIAARGLIAGGWIEAVRGILRVFAAFAEAGTLPNSIFGSNASNRDTSDAPLWFGAAAGELLDSDPSPETQALRPMLTETVRSLLSGYLAGTPNGIRIDPDSALVWSPAHFTWMDTNHPACTPREGYPVEIQVLWIRALRWLSHQPVPDSARWAELAERAARHLESLFWLEDHGWLADVLIAPPHTPAHRAVPDTALRPNMLLAVTLGALTGRRARRCVASALHHLLVPGALRSLAPLPVQPPLVLRSASGHPLNDPVHPYWGRYEGDEDTRRKPAYHNGTAWVWLLPSLAEAMATAWDNHPAARTAARAILASTDQLLDHGCLGQLPEILDGDAPHAQKGCDAQAWSVTETLRVWLALR